LTPFLLTLLIIPVSYIGADTSAGDLLSDVSETARLQTDMSRLDYLFTQFRVIVTYIRLLFLPINQNLDYDYPIYNSFLNPNVFLSFLLLLSILGLGAYLYSCSKNPPTSPFNKGGIKGGHSPFTVHRSLFTVHYLRLTAFGLFWFFITLSVESSVIPIVDVIFEHRMYLPSIGLIIAFVSAVFYFIPYLSSFNFQPSSFLSHHASRITVLLLAALVLSLSIATYKRNLVWQDEIRLWEDVNRKSPDKSRVHLNLGLAYQNHKRLEEAVREYYIALSLNPNYKEAYNNLGNIYKNMGFIDKAIEHYQNALKINPDFALAHNNLGFTYYYFKKWSDKAIEHYQIALRLEPYNAYTHLNLGIAYKSMGRFDEAKEQFDTAKRLNPGLFNTERTR
ncbi:MAG: tetratricopeptide repeat protein, partial [Nitrospirae bacterium]|nr:tetratricopeptide repeat protein [Nitrospirota bacterium]